MKPAIVGGENIRAIPFGENIVEARDLELKSIIGCPYSGVTFNVRQGDVFAIRGRNGSGKTALLLTVAGRMRSRREALPCWDTSCPAKCTARRNEWALPCSTA